MSERRELVVASLLQAHQLGQRLNGIPGVEFTQELDGWPKRRFTITATVEQWAEIDQHLKIIRGPE
jgi:hypothetical protein